MNHGLFFLPVLTLLALPVAARAVTSPDFDQDAKPILGMQPGLIQYVDQTFVVKPAGEAKYPGTDGRRPQPPFIFHAKPRGESGPYHLRLLIQPGPAGHILNVVDMNKVHFDNPLPSSDGQAPASNEMPTPANPPATAQAPAQQQQPAQATSAPTADTPSGPIKPAASQAPPSDTPPAR